MALTLDRPLLTATEVATVADVPRRYVDHVVEKHILPDDLCDGRRFLPSAATLVAVDSHLCELLTPKARKDAFRDVIVRYRRQFVDEPMSEMDGLVQGKSVLTVDVIKIDATNIFADVVHRYHELLEANMNVIVDPEILSGTPVIKGTRIPVHDIAASVEAGISADEILESYPGLTARKISLACLWAKAHPMVGRPKRALPPASGETKHIARKKLDS